MFKRITKKIAAGVLTMALMFGVNDVASAADDDLLQTAKPARKIIINVASRVLTLYNGTVRIGLYPLGLGKPSTPTPVGYYKINTKEIDPPWIDPSNPEYEVPSGASNPLGYRWMQIWGNYGIHGTNRPESIGTYASNGCIRMREADVETLFDLVDVGTPVEITYNRVVVEKAADDNIVYYIYPDGYGWQSIDTAYVNQWLTPYGVAAFESDEDIRQKISMSDGQPTYIGKAYPIEINGETIANWEQNGRVFSAKAVVRSGITYLPAVPIAMAIKTKLEWRSGAATLKTSYGEVVGFEQKKQIYFNADDAIVLFNLDGGLQAASTGLGKAYKLQTIVPIENSPADDKKSKRDRKKSDEDRVKPTDQTADAKDKAADNKSKSTDMKDKNVDDNLKAIDKSNGAKDKTAADDKLKSTDVKNKFADDNLTTDNSKSKSDRKIDRKSVEDNKLKINRAADV